MNARTIVADPAYARLKNLVIEHTGLAYYADKDDDFASRIAHRFSARGIRDCSSYLRLLDRGKPDPQEMDALVAELTIGETYFFRQSEHFDILRATILPEMLERNRLTRRLRIWSAGCANGAEAYSIALLIREALGEQAKAWHVHVLGTDINRYYLERAEAGRYNQWAFRENPEQLKFRYFRRDGTEWVIGQEARKWVVFRHHNLVSDPLPPPGETPDFDLIFCRNVMIYFSQEVIRATAARLYESLAWGGWLVVGHAEPNAENFSQFEGVMTGGVTVYRKMKAQPRAGPAASGRAELPPAAARPHVAKPRVETARQEHPRPAVAAPAVEVEEVRILADRGEWRLAAARARKLTETGSLNPAAHFVLALVLEHMGSPVDAAQSLRRSIFLDREFVMAHYHLGLVLEQQHDRQGARKAFLNVLDLVAARDGACILEHGDGISAAELRELTKMHLELLDSA
jgi:chemotaxis protein methyltransferase CheR